MLWLLLFLLFRCCFVVSVVLSSSSIAFGLLVCRFPSIISYGTNAGTFLMGGYGGGLIDLHMDTMKLSLFCHFSFILFGPKRAN